MPPTHYEIDILDPDEVAALLDACSRRSPSGLRNRALIATLYGAGLRISEAFALRPKDVDLDRLAVTVQRGKGGKRRVAAMLPDAAEIVARWADRRATLGLHGRHPLLCSISRGIVAGRQTAPGRPLSREYVAVNEAISDAGVVSIRPMTSSRYSSGLISSALHVSARLERFAPTAPPRGLP